MATMFGCCKLAAASASRRNRATSSGPARAPARIILRATSRFRLDCRAFRSDDVRVLQVGGGFRLAQKSCDLVRAGQGAGADHFEGHVTIQTRLPGLPI